MSARPRLVRSIPFWILLLGSLATTVFGVWLTLDKLGLMSAALTDGTATPVDVYVGQVWAIVGGILIATGLIGLALTLVTAVIRSFVPATDIQIVEAVDWSDAPVPADAATVEAGAFTESVAVLEAEPVEAEPVADTEDDRIAETASQR